MVGVGLATGGHDSDAPSNFRIQRPALRAAADPARWPQKWLSDRFINGPKEA